MKKVQDETTMRMEAAEAMIVVIARRVADAISITNTKIGNIAGSAVVAVESIAETTKSQAGSIVVEVEVGPVLNRIIHQNLMTTIPDLDQGQRRSRNIDTVIAGIVKTTVKVVVGAEVAVEGIEEGGHHLLLGLLT